MMPIVPIELPLSSLITKADKIVGNFSLFFLMFVTSPLHLSFTAISCITFLATVGLASSSDMLSFKNSSDVYPNVLMADSFAKVIFPFRSVSRMQSKALVIASENIFILSSAFLLRSDVLVYPVGSDCSSFFIWIDNRNIDIFKIPSSSFIIGFLIVHLS